MMSRHAGAMQPCCDRLPLVETSGGRWWVRCPACGNAADVADTPRRATTRWNALRRTQWRHQHETPAPHAPRPDA
jgi:hypothetical protein